MADIPTGGILAADSISKALGDLFKGAFGVEQATPDIIGKIGQQGAAQRQELLQQYQLPQQLEMERAKLGLLGAQTEGQQAAAELHRAQSGAVPSTMLLNQMRSVAQVALAKKRAADANKLAGDLERRAKYEDRIAALDPTAKDYSTQLGQILSEFDPRAPVLRELMKKEDPLIEQKQRALESLIKLRDAYARAYDADTPYGKARIAVLDARIKLYQAQADRARRDTEHQLTPNAEKNMLARLGSQASTMVDRAFQTETGKDFQSIPGTPTEKLTALNWYRQYILNNMLYMAGPEMHKYIDKEIDPKNKPKAIKALEEQQGKSLFDFSWLKKGLGKLSDIVTLQNAPRGYGAEKSPSISLPSGGKGVNDPLGILGSSGGTGAGDTESDLGDDEED